MGGAVLAIVKTVVLVQGGYGLGQRDTALALAAFGAGSMTIALLLPSLLDRVAEYPFTALRLADGPVVSTITL